MESRHGLSVKSVRCFHYIIQCPHCVTWFLIWLCVIFMGYTFVSFGFVLLLFAYTLRRFGLALLSFRNVLLSFGYEHFLFEYRLFSVVHGFFKYALFI